jgi:ketosteroid isomerase-like protein
MSEQAPDPSQESLELVESLMAAVDRRDIDAFAAVTTPDLEWFPVFAARVGGDVYRGRDGIEAFLGEIDETWEEFRPVPEEYRDLGDRVLALGRLRTRGRVAVGRRLRPSRRQGLADPHLPRSRRGLAGCRPARVGILPRVAMTQEETR